MDAPSLRNLEGLADGGSRGGAEMRAALLQVLTDLYVQKLTHTHDEERHYTELALRLIDSVDAPTRAAVAGQLGKHLSPPRQVIERLAEDLLESARSPSPHPERRPTATSPNELLFGQTDEARRLEDRAAKTAPAAAAAPAPISPAATGADIAAELNEIFFAASAHERRLILLNIDVVVPLVADRPRVARDPSVGLRLEAAALAQKRGDFVQVLAQSLRIPRQQARRIADDELGEPVVVVAKALGIRRDLLYRVLLFVNTAVGHSVERVHALAQLYDEITFHAAQDLVAIWQALADTGPDAGIHQPSTVRNRIGAQFAPAMRRAPVPRTSVRREAS
jgi:hypothetical protein